MKVLLFVGFLVVVLLMLLMNVQEGMTTYTVVELTNDKKTFDEAYEKARNKARGRILDDLKFSGGSLAGVRMREASYEKYPDMNNNMTKGQILSQFDKLIQEASSKQSSSETSSSETSSSETSSSETSSSETSSSETSS